MHSAYWLHEDGRWVILAYTMCMKMGDIDICIQPIGFMKMGDRMCYSYSKYVLNDDKSSRWDVYAFTHTCSCMYMHSAYEAS